MASFMTQRKEAQLQLGDSGKEVVFTTFCNSSGIWQGTGSWTLWTKLITAYPDVML